MSPTPSAHWRPALKSPTWLRRCASGVVLLCFEDVWAGQQCHRRLLAEHWQERTGHLVPELEPPQIQQLIEGL